MSKQALNALKKNQLDQDLEKFEHFPVPEFRKDSLVWWKENMKQFPALSAVALDIISAPVKEVSVERLFSHLKFILNRHRSQMKCNLINDILFLRMNHKFE